MISLTLPPLEEVRGIVLDMMPVIASDADQEAIADLVKFAEELILLLAHASDNPLREEVLKAILTGVVNNAV